MIVLKITYFVWFWSKFIAFEACFASIRDILSFSFAFLPLWYLSFYASISYNVFVYLVLISTSVSLNMKTWLYMHKLVAHEYICIFHINFERLYLTIYPYVCINLSECICFYDINFTIINVFVSTNNFNVSIHVFVIKYILIYSINKSVSNIHQYIKMYLCVDTFRITLNIQVLWWSIFRIGRIKFNSFNID